MEELELGPNGGLVYCMEYLLDNMDWLKDELDKFDDDEYIIFDCPGQVRCMLSERREIAAVAAQGLYGPRPSFDQIHLIKYLNLKP